MAKITFLGVGNAFTMADWQSNLLVEADDGAKLLLDCGSDIRWSLAELGYGAADIAAVYLSHVHADHIGGMEWLAYNSYFNPSLSKPALFFSRDIEENLRECLEPSLSPIKDAGEVVLDTFFRVKPTLKKFRWRGILFELVATEHVPAVGDGLGKMSYGLKISRKGGKKVFWTSDTLYNPLRHSYRYRWADIILQDCELGFATGVHAHISELSTLPAQVREKMLLYHYNHDAVSQHADELSQFQHGLARKGMEIPF